MSDRPSQPIETNWFEQHTKLTLLIVNIVFILLAECSIRILAFYGVVPIKQFITSDITGRFLGDINPHFGVWHFPNRSVRHTGPCFDVENTSNSYGARDKERSLESTADQRVVVLGDSFIEGIGVSANQRLTDLAEELTGVEILNFGVSGDFSSTQAWLLYRELASKFKHSEVHIYHLPANDFKDNDPSSFPESRYRPYLRKISEGETPEFEIYYTVPFEERMRPKPVSTARLIRRTLYNYIYVLNVIRQIGDFIEHSDWKDYIDDQAMSKVTADYDNFTSLDIERLLWGYRQIIKHAGNRPVTIKIIPREAEFLHYKDKGYNFRIIHEIERLAKEYPNVKVVDLLPIFIEYAEKNNISYEDFFIACDGHWSQLGHRVAAQEIAQKIIAHE